MESFAVKIKKIRSKNKYSELILKIGNMFKMYFFTNYKWKNKLLNIKMAQQIIQRKIIASD